jgi:hypothetical protein
MCAKDSRRLTKKLLSEDLSVAVVASSDFRAAAAASGDQVLRLRGLLFEKARTIFRSKSITLWMMDCGS